MEQMTPALLASQVQQVPFTPAAPSPDSYRDFYVYEVPVFTNLAAAGGQATNNLQIQNDSDFEWCASCYEFDLAAAQTTQNARNIPNMTVLIFDSGSGRQFMNAAVPVINIFGTLEVPFYLPITKVLTRNSLIGFTATNFDAAVATGNLRLSLLGYKIKYFK